jgi:hypothetical protein
MPRKKKTSTKVELENTIQYFSPCEWVVQFDNDEPVVFTEADENSTNKEVIITLGNDSNSYIKFTDPNTGKFFKLFAREKLS